MKHSEQRQERRLSLFGFRLKIRRRGWGWMNGCHSAVLADLSANGLSFVLHRDQWAPLDKISFVLQVRDMQIRGSGVLCHKSSESGGRWRYGLMLLNVSQEFEALLKEIEYQPEEVRAVAKNMADQFLLNSCQTESERARLHKQLLLWEASSAFIHRLSVIHKMQLPVTVCQEGVTLSGTQGICKITATDARPGYAASTGEEFANVFEVLEFLGAQLKIP